MSALYESRFLISAGVLLAASVTYTLFSSTKPGDDRLAADSGLVAVPEEQTLVADPDADGPQKQPVEFELRNASQRTIRVLSVETSCGCTVVSEMERTVLQPGETTSVNVMADLPDFGSKLSHVEVRTDFPGQPVVRFGLTLKGRPLKVPYMTYQPDEIRLRDSGPESTGAEVVLTTVEQKDAGHWIRTLKPRQQIITLASESVKEEPGPTEEAVRRTYRFVVQARPDEGAQASRREVLDIESTDSEDRHFDPILVTVTSAPRVRVVPDSVFVKSSALAKIPVERTLLVQSTASADSLDVTVEPTDDDWFEARVEKTETSSGVRHKIVVRILSSPQAAGDTGPFVKGYVRIRTSDSDYSRFEIPIVVSVR